MPVCFLIDALPILARTQSKHQFACSMLIMSESSPIQGHHERIKICNPQPGPKNVLSDIILKILEMPCAHQISKWTASTTIQLAQKLGKITPIKRKIKEIFQNNSFQHADPIETSSIENSFGASFTFYLKHLGNIRHYFGTTILVRDAPSK